MPDNPAPLPVPGEGRLARTLRWARRRRRTALGLLLRGVCYGTGTGLVSMLVFWLQHRG
ncbi:hypothetical protein [Streptomyces sp. NPDC049555]|uniref:hypothetical protein n=1 Tax=unclassified Streptomyces TaxID=2593676 RepID=UPI00342C7CA1